MSWRHGSIERRTRYPNDAGGQQGAHPERPGYGGADEVGIDERGERNEPDIRDAMIRSAGNPQRQARLPDSAGAGKRDEADAVAPHQGSDGSDFAGAADKAGPRHRQRPDRRIKVEH